MINSALLQLPALEALVDCLQRRGMAANFERKPICRLSAAYRRLAAALPAYGRYTLFEWVQSSLMGALSYRTRIDETFFSPRVEYRTPDGKRHRDGDQPAVEWADGSRMWGRNGKLHRDGGRPAEEWANGYRAWWRNGERHRDGDRPAVEWPDGTRQWWRDGVQYTPADE